jgi:hypothetical protein
MSRTSKIVPIDIIFLSVFEFDMISHFGRAFSQPNDKPGNLAGAMGCLPHLRFFAIQLPTRRVAVNVISMKGGEKPGNGQVVNSVGFLLPCDPENSGPQGGLAIQGEVTTSGLKYT